MINSIDDIATWRIKVTERNTINPQLELLKKHFPNCFDKSGAFIVEKLQEVVQENGVNLSKEGYGINWLGKSYARVLANQPVQTLLKANLEHNSLPDNINSQNLLIKGDNLEVLKHLVGAYSEKIKMIYIDPPYNTGSDGFVYQDDRKFTKEQLSQLAGIDEDDAARVLEFTQSKSNSHSAWLTFMYPRLYIARQLLRDDGVIFISIDSNESAQLKILCDEVFGEDNFVECITWNKRIPKNDKGIGSIHEYIYIYVNNAALKIEFTMAKDGLDEIYVLLDKLKNQKKSIHEAEKEIKKLYKKNQYDRGITLYNNLDDSYKLWGKINMSWPNADTFGDRYDVIHPATGKPVNVPERGWRWTKDTFEDAAKIEDGKYTEIFQRHDGSYVCGRIWFSTDENMQPSSISKLDDVEYFLLRSILSMKSNGGIELDAIFEGKSIFSYPKPTTLLKTLCESIQDKNAIILDFFAGSGTTAHAVMQLNAEDNGFRKFICVQLDESTDPKKEAHKVGYKTIYEITKERIKRAAKKIKNDKPEAKCDFGSKQFETIPVFEHYLDEPEELTANLELFDAAKLTQQDRHNLMLTWQLRDGITLTETLIPLELAGYVVYQGKDILYFIEPELSTPVIATLLEQLDTNPNFMPRRLVVLGYLLDSKTQREMTEAVKHYNNRKGIELTLDIRY